MLPVLAIDGPVGVGKSTVARRVAGLLGLRHLDTGAMYRVVALRVMQLPAADHRNEELVIQTARNTDIDLAADGRVLADGHDVSDAIRTESVSRFVSLIADNGEVRRVLVDKQRELGSRQASVLEGRDIGTVVFPDAAVKIFLDAAPRARAQRRIEQLHRMGLAADLEDVYRALEERDRRDRSRPWGALKLAQDAVLVDSTHYTEDLVVELITSIVRRSPIFQQALAAHA